MDELSIYISDVLWLITTNDPDITPLDIGSILDAALTNPKL